VSPFSFAFAFNAQFLSERILSFIRLYLSVFSHPSKESKSDRKVGGFFAYFWSRDFGTELLNDSL